LSTRTSRVTLGNVGRAAVSDRRADMAQVIEFYIPARFHKKVKWIPPEQRGKVIDFPAEIRKSA
jgi:hypothetical protein